MSENATIEDIPTYFKVALQPDAHFNVGGKSFRSIVNNDVPQKLYKYRPLNKHTICLIRDACLFHASKDSFNDPLDGINKFRLLFDDDDITDLVSSFSDGAKREEEIHFFSDHPDEFENIVRDLAFSEIAQFGITCFASKVDNTLMWAHYSDNHKGVCIEFQFAKEIDPARHNLIDPLALNLLYIRRVAYDDDVPTVTYKEIGRERFTPTYHKSIKWEYESEYRAIRPSVGAFPFHKSCVTAIYVGLKASAKGIKSLKRAVAESGYENVEFYRMAETDSYDLKIVSL